MIKRLNMRREEGLFRKLPADNDRIDFSSNDYLGFARSPELKKLVDAELDSLSIPGKTGFGSTGSRLLTGDSRYAAELERFIAGYHRADAGLIFNSGYAANIGLLSSVARKGDVVLYDELSHASIYDGVRLSKAESFPFKHNDVAHLEERLKFFRSRSAPGAALPQEIFVVVESVYSMDGDFAPLIEIASLCEDYQANLIVDEAHATGIFGNKGEGKVAELGLEDSVFARVHTFGKALGGHGAIVLGGEALKDYLVNFSRAFIYTTALPLHALVVIKSAYILLQSISNNMFNFNNLIHSFIDNVDIQKMPGFLKSYSPIQSLVIAGNEQVKEVAVRVQADGYDVRPILSPTVPRGKERIRICLHAFNTEEEIKGLFHSVKRHTAKLPENIFAGS